jgi:diguanylate cyclase (GGDEF)-like protein
VVLSAVQDAQQAYGVGKKIIAAWEPHAVRYESIGPVTLSIGISLYPDDADTVEALLRHADNAMYGVKKSGKNGCRLYQRSSVNGSA